MFSSRTNSRVSEKSLEDPEDFAVRLLSRAEQEFPSTDLGQVIRSLGGIEVIKERLDADGYLLEFGPESAEILVKSDSPAYRQRFTIAHELGHLVLSRNLKATSRNVSQREIERWCDQFAASLLMPTQWMKELIGSFERLSKSDVLLTGQRRLDVSRGAFYKRMHELFEISVLEIASDDRFWVWPVVRSRKVSILGKSHFVRTRLWSDLKARQARSEQNGSRVVGPFRADSANLRNLEFAPNTRWVFVILMPLSHVDDDDGFEWTKEPAQS
jgi:Zn-dependent peptidase ImmA (M78 family)